MAELSETKIKALIRLIKHKRITLEDIKNEEYRAEVKNRLQQ